MGFTDFVKSLGSKIKHVAVSVAHGFEAVFGKQAAHDFAQAALGLLKSDLGQLVVAEVEALAGVSDLTGAQKAAQAQGAVLEKAKTLGLSASTSIVNMLIEVAVQFVRGNLQAAAAIAAPASEPASPTS